MQGSEEGQAAQQFLVKRGRRRRRRRRRRSRRIMPSTTTTSSTSNNNANISNHASDPHDGHHHGLAAMDHLRNDVPTYHDHDHSSAFSSSSSSSSISNTTTIDMDAGDDEARDGHDAGNGDHDDDDGKDAMNIDSVVNDDEHDGGGVGDDEHDVDGGDDNVEHDDDSYDDGHGHGHKHEEEFKCNICLNTASDAVVTLCGHLFCWSCLYTWLHFHSKLKQCPVCKGSTNETNLIPIYNTCNTTTTSTTITTSKSTIAINHHGDNNEDNDGNEDGDEDEDAIIPPRPHAPRGQIEACTLDHPMNYRLSPNNNRNTTTNNIYNYNTTSRTSNYSNHHHHHHNNYSYNSFSNMQDTSYHLMLGRESRASWLERLRAMREERLAWPVAFVQGLTSRELMQQRRRQAMGCGTSNSAARPMSSNIRSTADQLHLNHAISPGVQDFRNADCDHHDRPMHENAADHDGHDFQDTMASSLSGTQSSTNTSSNMHTQFRLGEQQRGMYPMGGGATSYYLSTMNSILTSMEVFARALEVSTMSTEYFHPAMPTWTATTGANFRCHIDSHYATSPACTAPSQLSPVHGPRSPSSSTHDSRQSPGNNVFMHDNYEDNGNFNHFNYHYNHNTMDQDQYYASVRGLLGKMERLMAQLQSIKPTSMVSKQPNNNNLIHPMADHCRDVTMNYLNMPHHHSMNDYLNISSSSSFARKYRYDSRMDHYSDNFSTMMTTEALMLERISSSSMPTPMNNNTRSSSHPYSNVSSSNSPCDGMPSTNTSSLSTLQPSFTNCKSRKRWDMSL